MTIQQIEIQFLDIYPNGFIDDNYLAETKRFDDQKIINIFNTSLSSKNMLECIESNNFSELVKPVLDVINKSWMTSRFEKIGFKHYMKHTETHDHFFILLYEVLYGDLEQNFDRFIEHLKIHFEIDNCSHVAKWPIISCFLYYSRHKYYPVKPTTTKKIAAILGHTIDYKPTPNLNTYTLINKMYNISLNESTLCKNRQQIDAMLYIVLI